MQTNSSSSSKTKYIIKDGVTISGTNIILNANRNTIYSYFFNSGSEFSISVKTGTITKIEFSGNASLKNLNCDGYTLMSDFRAEWNGSAKKYRLRVKPWQEQAQLPFMSPSPQPPFPNPKKIKSRQNPI